MDKTLNVGLNDLLCFTSLYIRKLTVISRKIRFCFNAGFTELNPVNARRELLFDDPPAPRERHASSKVVFKSIKYRGFHKKGTYSYLRPQG